MEGDVEVVAVVGEQDLCPLCGGGALHRAGLHEAGDRRDGRPDGVVETAVDAWRPGGPHRHGTPTPVEGELGLLDPLPGPLERSESARRQCRRRGGRVPGGEGRAVIGADARGGLERQRTGDGRRRRGVHRGKAVGQRRREPVHEREEIARGAVEPGSMGDLARCHVDDLGRDVDVIADALVRALDQSPGIRSRAPGTFLPAALVGGLRRGAQSAESAPGSGCRARRRRPAPGPECGCEGFGDVLANPVVVATLAQIDEGHDGKVERLATRARRRSRGRCERTLSRSRNVAAQPGRACHAQSDPSERAPAARVGKTGPERPARIACEVSNDHPKHSHARNSRRVKIGDPTNTGSGKQVHHMVTRVANGSEQLVSGSRYLRDYRLPRRHETHRR